MLGKICYISLSVKIMAHGLWMMMKHDDPRDDTHSQEASINHAWLNTNCDRPSTAAVPKWFPSFCRPIAFFPTNVRCNMHLGAWLFPAMALLAFIFGAGCVVLHVHLHESFLSRCREDAFLWLCRTAGSVAHRPSESSRVRRRASIATASPVFPVFPN